MGKGARVGLLIAAAVALALEHIVPGGRLLLYPFTLLATWVHEMGHGVTAMILGGHFEHLEIYRDASGLAYTAIPPGLRSALVCAGGLVAPPVAGAAIMAFARNPKRGGAVLMALSIALTLSVALWVRSAVGVVSMLPMALLLAAFSLYGGRARTVLAQFVGVLFALDTFARLDYLFMSSATIGGTARPSDVSGIAAGLFPPAILWGVLIAVLDVALLYAGLRAAWKPGGSALGTGESNAAATRARQGETV